MPMPVMEPYIEKPLKKMTDNIYLMKDKDVDTQQ
jgi:hypothetical protein